MRVPRDGFLFAAPLKCRASRLPVNRFECGWKPSHLVMSALNRHECATESEHARLERHSEGLNA